MRNHQGFIIQQPLSPVWRHTSCNRTPSVNEGTAARILTVFGAEALTEATTPGHGYMKRCRDNMRSVLGEADTLKSAGISPGLMWKKRRILNIKRPTSKRMSLYFYK